MLHYSNWSSSPNNLQLESDAIHLWQASLDCEDAVLQRLEDLLSQDEKARAARFVFSRDRHRFIAARGILRAILGQYVRRDPTDIAFTYGTHGKPALRLERCDPIIYFNLSHSHSIAAYAFADRREVGVDVEAIRHGTATNETMDLAFSENEIAELHAMPPEIRDKAFSLGWTRKEAYLKARGTGIALPLGSIEVSLSPDQPEILRTADSSRWSMRSFEPAPGYVGAVVGEGQDWELRLWTWADRNQPT